MISKHLFDDVEPLVEGCVMYAELGAEPLDVGAGPCGGRLVANVVGGPVSGHRINGTLVGAGADWILLGAMAPGGSTDYGDQYFRTTPRVETGDERYAWVNRTLLVAESRLHERCRVPHPPRHPTGSVREWTF